MEQANVLELSSPSYENPFFQASWVEPFVSDYFLALLASMHYLAMASTDYEKLLLPHTTSPLYNMSRCLNMSVDPRDQYYRSDSFHFYGYPSDTFAVYFMRKSPQFILVLQFIVFGMLLCFTLMAGVLVYLTFFSKDDKRRRVEVQEQALKQMVNEAQKRKAASESKKDK